MTLQDPKINWSVWDSNPVVAWTWKGVHVSVQMREPPISVALLSRLERVAIVGTFDELGSSNLRLYSYDGALDKTYSAPPIGEDACFGGVQEMTDGFEVSVGFRENNNWKEVVGKWNPDDGDVSAVHRGY